VELLWTRSAAERFSRYVIRSRAGTEAPTGDDSILATIEGQDQTGLETGGMYTQVARVFPFRVWVVDTNEHIAASNSVTVEKAA